MTDPVNETRAMGSVAIREFSEADRDAVVELWRECGLVREWNDPDRDIDRKLAVDDAMFLVASNADRVIGTVMAGYDGHRGWINYLAVHPTGQRGGIGALLMEEAESLLLRCGCAKVNLQIRSTNASMARFYQRLGYATDEVVSMGKRLVHDTPHDTVIDADSAASGSPINGN